MGRPGPTFLILPYPLLFHREKTVEQHNPSEPPGPTLAHTSKQKTINDGENLAIKYRAPAQKYVSNMMPSCYWLLMAKATVTNGGRFSYGE